MFISTHFSFGVSSSPYKLKKKKFFKLCIYFALMLTRFRTWLPYIRKIIINSLKFKQKLFYCNIYNNKQIWMTVIKLHIRLWNKRVIWTPAQEEFLGRCMNPIKDRHICKGIKYYEKNVVEFELDEKLIV